VSWTAPHDGGSPITAYAVVPFIAGSAQAAHAFDSARTSQMLAGLTNGTAYTFTVVAINALGAGRPSEPSPPVTPSATATRPSPAHPPL
jgi:hypothetical protein